MARPLLAVFAAAVAGAAEPVDFNRDVRPILNEKCMGCHGGVKHAGGISVQYREDILGKGESGQPSVVPGKPEESELIRRILTDDHDDRMPKEKPPLSKAETDILVRWVKEGAKWDDHWSFLPPKPHPAPAVRRKEWVRNPVDAFVLARLEQAGLRPSPEAGKAALLRRVTLDLTGLPPTAEETAAFLADTSPAAYEKVVDRLLASPRFGERWATMWLDLARYGDSKALGHDSPRPIWPYRDWVIRAFNQDMPWDQFIIRQMAGDLMPEPERDLVATGFHRLTKSNDEGGTSDEEYRTYAVIDRVNTTWNAFMGLQMACVQCHGHPYDALRDKDYYGSYAFLNQSQDSDKPDDRPTIPFPSDPAAERRLRAAIAEAGKTALSPDAAKSGWSVLKPSRAVSLGGAILTADQEGLVRASGPRPDASVSELDLPPGRLAKVAALALDIPGAPGKPAGRHPNGNFVLSAVEVSRVSAGSAPVMGRRLRIDIPGKGKVINVSEIEVLDASGRNLALGAKASQSSTYPGYPASNAVNGKRSTGVDDVTSTDAQDNPWLEIDLGAAKAVAALRIWNRMDSGNDARLTGALVSLLDDSGRATWSRRIALKPSRQLVEMTLDRPELALPLAGAEATHSQDAYPASSVLENAGPATSGWAVSPRMGEAHRLTLRLAAPAELAPGEQLRVRLHHAHAKPGFVGMDLAAFRISATDAPSAADAPLGTLASLRQQLEKLPKVRMPVMMDLPPDKRRKTHVLVRGAWNSPGEAIAEAFTPATLHPFPKDQPRDRLGFARWIASKDNPLTARVAINYLWQELFGSGLVSTSEDFGTMGEKPSHPELLDTLAHRLMNEWGWSPKRALREMVLSSTYRQTAQATAELREKDPKNRLLGRAPRKRLSGEMIRDQSLALAGLLNTAQTEGPPYVPPSPGGYLRNAFSGASEVSVTTDAGRFRRSVYGFWKRLEPFAVLTIFDASDRDTCATRRVNTNSPLQALTTLNEEILVEAQKGFGRRLLQEPGDDAAKVRAGFALVGEHDPRPASVHAALGLLESSRRAYAADTELARKAGLTPEEAAWWQVATVLLNSDTALNRD